MSKPRAMLTERMIPVAAEFACLVRDREWPAVDARLSAMGVSGKARDVFVAMAAMVPDDRPVSELLAWMDDSREAQLRRAHATAVAYRLRNEPVPDDVAVLDREWDRNRKRAATRRRAA